MVWYNGKRCRDDEKYCGVVPTLALAAFIHTSTCFHPFRSCLLWLYLALPHCTILYRTLPCCTLTTPFSSKLYFGLPYITTALYGWLCRLLVWYKTQVHSSLWGVIFTRCWRQMALFQQDGESFIPVVQRVFMPISTMPLPVSKAVVIAVVLV